MEKTKDKVSKIPFEIDNKKFTLNISGFEVTEVEGHRKPAITGAVQDLMIMDRSNGKTKEYRIESVSEGAILRTQGSGCFWYFSGGMWIRYCQP